MNTYTSSKTESGLQKEFKTLQELKKDKEKSRARVVLKNSGALGLSTILGKIFYFLLFILIGRYLGPSDLGKFTFALSFVAMFAVINDLGLSILAVRDVAKEKNLAGKYLSNIATLKVVLGLFAFSLVMLFVNLMGYPKDNIKIVLLMGLASLFITVSSGMRWLFQAYQKLEYESIVSVLQNILYFGLGFLAISLGLGVYGVGYSQIVVGILIVFFSWILVKGRFFKVKLEIDLGFWKKILKKSAPFALMLVFTGLYLNADTVILSFFKGDKAVGLYNAANKLVVAAKMLPAVVVPALFPVMSEITDWSKFKRLIEKAIHYMLALALPIGVGVTILSHKIILTVYGKEFALSSLPLQILIWSAACVFLNGILGYALIAKGYQKVNTIIVGIGVLISLILNFILIPKLSYLGTSVSILCTEFFVFLGAWFLVYKKLGISLFTLKKSLGKIGLCCLLMGIGIYLLQLWNMGLLTIIPVGGFIYLFSLIRVDEVLAKDWTDFKNGFTISSFVQRKVFPFVGTFFKGVKR